MIFFRIIIFLLVMMLWLLSSSSFSFFSDITPFFRLNSLSCLFLYETLDIIFLNRWNYISGFYFFTFWFFNSHVHDANKRVWKMSICVREKENNRWGKLLLDFLLENHFNLLVFAISSSWMEIREKMWWLRCCIISLLNLFSVGISTIDAMKLSSLGKI